MVSWRSNEAAMLRSIAQRCGVLRLSCRPATPCLMVPYSDDVAVFVALQADRRPVLEAHAEREAVALEHFLDLGERLLAEIRRAQQLDFGLLHEVADVVDVLGLEAVRAADR